MKSMMPILILALAGFGDGQEPQTVQGRQAPPTTTTTLPSPPALFRSGFESGVTVDPPTLVDGETSQVIWGSDQGFSWQTNLPRRSSPDNRFTYLVSPTRPLSQLNDYVDTRIESLPGWDGKPTRALRMELKMQDPLTSEGTRNQFAIFPDSAQTQSYIRYRLKLQPDLDVVLTPGHHRSLMLTELKEGAPTADFRWNLFVQRDPDISPDLFWRAQAQLGGLENSPQVWECTSKVPVPVGEWAVFEVFWKLDPTKGRIAMAVNGNTIVDYRGQTQKDSGVSVWWPWKLYTGTQLAQGLLKGPFYQWVDDVEIRTEPPEDRHRTPNSSNTCKTF